MGGIAGILNRSPEPPSPRWWLHPGVAAIVAIFVRAAAAGWLGTLAEPETFETEELVRNLLAGRGYAYPFLGTAYRSFHSILPYDLLTAGVYLLSRGSQTAMLVVQWMVAGLSCLAVSRLGHRLGGPGVAGIAAWLVALHPGLVVYDATKLQQISFDAFLVALGLLAFIRWGEQPSLMRAGAAGAVVGLLMYERGTMGLFFPVAALWVRQTSRLPWGRWARQAAWCVVVAGVVVGPWILRNTLVHHRFMPMMSTTWLALWKGNHATATGTEYAPGHQPIVPDHLPPHLQDALKGANELKQMETFRHAALTFIREEPLHAASLFCRKLGFFWWRSPYTGLQYRSSWSVGYQGWYLLLLLGGAYGIVTLARSGGGVWSLGCLVLWLAACSSVGQALFYVAGRHRWMIEPTLGVLSAVGCWRLVRQRVQV